jgi:PAS domain S-box-containing protein
MAVVLMGGEVPADMECMAERPDGTRFWFTPYPAVLRDTEGRVIGSINLLIDITDRKNTQVEVSDQFRAIVETMPECVKIVAPDGALLFMNPAGLEMIGASCPEAVVGKSVYNVIAPEDRERFREFNHMICGGQRGSLQFEVVGLKGERRHMETHAAPLRYTDASIVHLAVSHDITERTRGESSSFLLSAIVDSSDDAIISKDLDGVITSWNQSAQRLFGYTAEEAIGQTVASLLIPEDRQEEEPRYTRAAQAGRTRRSLRDGATAKRRVATRYLADYFTSEKSGRGDHWCFEDRPRYHRKQAHSNEVDGE